MRSLLRWLQVEGNLRKVQAFPNPIRVSGPEKLVAYVDASWNIQSVSGGIVTYQEITLKTFSRKQDVPALSSAEAEFVRPGPGRSCFRLCLLDTLQHGIPFNALGGPRATTRCGWSSLRIPSPRMHHGDVRVAAWGEACGIALCVSDAKGCTVFLLLSALTFFLVTGGR